MLNRYLSPNPYSKRAPVSRYRHTSNQIRAYEAQAEVKRLISRFTMKPLLPQDLTSIMRIGHTLQPDISYDATTDATTPFVLRLLVATQPRPNPIKKGRFRTQMVPPYIVIISMFFCPSLPFCGRRIEISRIFLSPSHVNTPKS
jgi:hypothetical protein